MKFGWNSPTAYKEDGKMCNFCRRTEGRTGRQTEGQTDKHTNGLQVIFWALLLQIEIKNPSIS